MQHLMVLWMELMAFLKHQQHIVKNHYMDNVLSPKKERPKTTPGPFYSSLISWFAVIGWLSVEMHNHDQRLWSTSEPTVW
jgi:hypothetical protein